MGGTTLTYKGETLMEVIEALIENSDYHKDDKENGIWFSCGLWLDSLTIMCRNEKGKWYCIGSNGIEVPIATNYSVDLNTVKARFVLMAHFGK